MVRLTNEYQMNEQTDEDGHLFLWFKHQATQGVLDAQVGYNLGYMDEFEYEC